MQTKNLRYDMRFFVFIVLFYIGLPSISYAQCPITVNAGDDIYVCSVPTAVPLNGSIDGTYISFQWTPAQGLNSTTILTPTANVTQNATYILTGRAADLSNNLIANGNFDGGNTGFTSDYVYTPGNLVPESTYDIIPNPQDSHPGFAPCSDHTGGGDMLVVNGSGTPGQDVWCQSVPTSPNTIYILTAWVTSVVSASPAQLQFSVNGSTLGPIFIAPSTNCLWQNYYQIWNSGANTSANICILNQNTTLGGNDFALDDIIFSPVCVETDTVKIRVVNIAAVASPSVVNIPCAGANVTLSGAGSSTGANITYDWSTSNGNIVSGETTLSPVVNAAGAYVLTVTFTQDGTVCTKTATVNVVQSPNQLVAIIAPPQPFGCGGNTVNLIGISNQPAFSTYLWTTSDGNIVSGSTLPTCVISQPGTYELMVTNSNTGCTATTMITVGTATNPPTAVAAAGNINCVLPTAALSGAGSTTGTSITYTWSAYNGGTINGATNGINATAGSGGNYILTVLNTVNGCFSKDTIIVTANLTPPTLSINTAEPLDCNTDTLGLFATIAPPNATLAWTASGGGNIVSGGNTPQPQINAVGVYTLLVTNPANMCTATSSITITSDYALPTANILMPDSITCQSPAVVLSGSGSSTGSNFTYLWNAGTGGNIVSGETTLNPTVNAAATYTLIVTNTTNGCTAFRIIPVVSDTNVVTAIASANDTLACNLNTLVLDANGSSVGSNIQYQWTTTNGFIVSGSNTPNPTVNTPGNYLLTITNNANGCSATDGALVLIDTIHPQISIAPPAQLTCANPTLSLQGQNLSPTGNFTYIWTTNASGNIVSGATTLTPLISTAATYTLTATNLNTGCTTTVTTTVDIETGTPTALANVAGPLTCITPNQTLQTTGSSVGSAYQYTWYNPSGTTLIGNNPTVSQSGMYQLIIKNTQNGCADTTTVTILEDKAAPLAEAGITQVLTCLQQQASLIANSGSPLANLNFLWTSTSGSFVGATNMAQATVNTAGWYKVLVSNIINGCTAIDSVQIITNQTLPTLAIATPTVLNCLQTSMTLVATGTGNQLSYQWLGAGILSGGNTGSPVIDAPNTYTVTATDGLNGCTSVASVTVLEDIALPLIQIAPGSVITCVNPSFILSAQHTNATGTPTYTWAASNGGNIMSGANGLMPQINAGGTYTITVTNNVNGCTATNSIQVLQNTALPAALAGADATLDCNTNAFVLQGSGNGTSTLNYLWTATQGGTITAGANTPNATITTAGLYTLKVTDTANGCTSTDLVQIFNDADAPLANAGPPVTLNCTLLETNLQGTGSIGANISYQWMADATGNIVSGANTLTPLINDPGIYTLVVTNITNGCTFSATVTIPENIAPPTANAGNAAGLNCTLSQLALNAGGSSTGVTYQWATIDGNIVSGVQTVAPMVNQPGTYTLVVTATQNGCTATDDVLIGIDTIHPLLSILSPQILTCTVQSVVVTGMISGTGNNNTLGWSTQNGQITGGQNTLEATVSEAGTYVFEVKNNINGCSSTQSVTVTEDVQIPLAAANAPNLLTCADTEVNMDGTGSSTGIGFTYLWSGPQVVSGANTLMPIVGQLGVYTLMVTNTSNGCSKTTTATVGTNTTAPVLSIGTPGQLTCKDSVLTLAATVTSGGTNYSASWTSINGNIIGGQNGLLPTINKIGTYVLNVQNQTNGCSTQTQVTVTENKILPDAQAGAGDALNCNEPEVTLDGSSSTSNVQYLWTSTDGQINSGANTPNPVVDATGVYRLVVTNPQNGCTNTDMVEVTQIEDPIFETLVDQPDCLEPLGSISFQNMLGGIQPYRFSVDGGQSYQASGDFSNLASGSYNLIISDQNGCTATESIQLSVPLIPTLSLPPYYQITLGDKILLMPTTNIPPIQIDGWLWATDTTLSCFDCESPLATPLRSTKYTVTVTNEDGCTATAATQVRVDRKRNLYAPNIFSPNGDGKNDYFTLFAKGVVKIHNLAIFDRWGNQLFSAKDIQPNDELAGWNGIFQGKLLNPAVFVWHAVVEFIDGEKETFFGDITLQ